MATRSITAKAPTCSPMCESWSGCGNSPTQDRSLWVWHQNIANGQPDRRNVTIVLMNEARQPVLSWHAENAWVNKIEGPSFKASGNEIAMESVELVHEGLTIEAAA